VLVEEECCKSSVFSVGNNNELERIEEASISWLM
jgi:hypothetical protein